MCGYDRMQCHCSITVEAILVLNEANSLVLAKLALVEFGFDPDAVPLTFVKMRENTVFRAETPIGAIDRAAPASPWIPQQARDIG